MDIPGDDDPDVSGNVFTQKSKHEPDEFDPDSLGPPTPTPSETDYQSDVAGLFVKLVVVFNVALLALALGPMLAYFRGQVDLGLRVFLVGVIAFSYGTYEYVKFTRRDGDDEEGGGEDDGEQSGEGAHDEASAAEGPAEPAVTHGASDETPEATGTHVDDGPDERPDHNG